MELYFLGNGELMEETRQMVKDKSLETEIHFEGVVDNVKSISKEQTYMCILPITNLLDWFL